MAVGLDSCCFYVTASRAFPSRVRASRPPATRSLPGSLHFRFARDDEIPAIGRLAAHSFPAASRTPAWWEEHLREPRYGAVPFVGVADGRPVASCLLHPMRQYVGGVALPCAGVGTVAISPARRRRRHAAALMVEAMRAARERGDVVSSLYPFRSSFYRRLGYGDAGAALQWQVAPAELADAPDRHGVEVLESVAELADAAALYERWAATQTGQMQRNDRVWSSLLAPQDRVLFGCHGSGGQLEGYALVTYRPDLPRQTRFLEVDELVWITPAARRGLCGWLSSLGDQWEQLLIRTLPSHRFGDWLREPRLPPGAAPGWGLWSPAATLLMGPMFRLLDIDAAWAQRRVQLSTAMTATVEVTDAALPENSGVRRIAFTEGRADVDPGTDADLTLRLETATLARLFIGALSANAGVAAGLIECDRPDRLPALDAVLALPEPWTFDRF